jgi:hypothetical protein
LSEKLGYFSNPKISAGFGSQGIHNIKKEDGLRVEQGTLRKGTAADPP